MSFSDIGAGLGSMTASIALLAGAAGKGGKKEFKEIVRLWRDLENAGYDFRSLQPAQLQLVAEYFPELYQEFVPEDVKTISDSPEMRSAQVRGLQRIEQMAEGGLPLEDRLATDEATRALQGVGQQRQKEVTSQLARRGQLGTGDELQARLMGEQSQMELARNLGSDISRNILSRRLAANEALMSGAGAVRGQDVSTQAQNARIVNAFNELIARTRNEAAMKRTDDINRARMERAGQRQRIYGEQNPLLAAEGQRFNLTYQNQLKQQQYQDSLARLRGLSDALAGLGNVKYAEQAAKAKTIKSGAEGGGKAAGGVVDLFGGGGLA